MPNPLPTPLAGIFPPLVTPLRDRDTLDVAGLERLIEHVLAGGVHGLFLLGTTGEGPGLSQKLRAEVVERGCRQVAGRVPVWCGTTAIGTREVVRQMRAAKDLGAAAAFVGLPLWQTPTMENAVGFFADLSEAVPDLPVMVYANRFFFSAF